MQLLAKSKIGQEVLIIGEIVVASVQLKNCLNLMVKLAKSTQRVVAVYIIFPYKNNRTLIFNLIGSATKMMH